MQWREAELALAAKELKKQREKLEKDLKRLRTEMASVEHLEARWAKVSRHASSFRCSSIISPHVQAMRCILLLCRPIHEVLFFAVQTRKPRG